MRSSLARVHGREPRLDPPGEESGRRSENKEAVGGQGSGVGAAAAATAVPPANEDSEESLTGVAESALG